MYMLGFLKWLVKSICVDFTNWVYIYSEEIFGIPMGFVLVSGVQLGNELVHTIFTVISALLSAYFVHLLKKMKFKINFRLIIKKIFKK